METIAFIPARGGSKSIPLKNIKPFCGKPLLYWSIKAAQNLAGITSIVVATDDDDIEKVALSSDCDKVSVYRRDSRNAQDNSSTESVMLEYIKHSSIDPNTVFILVQATSPLLSSENLRKGLDVFKKHDSVLSCVRSKRFFWDEEGKAINYDPDERPRRQDFDGLLMENGAFYVSTVKDIISSKNRISGNIGIVEMPEYTAVEIDEEEDWIVAESLMKRFNAKLLQEDNDMYKKPVKLFVTDVDGVLTDAGMYYSEKGDELKKFNTHDGMAFQLLREQGIKTAIITSEKTEIVKNRAKKLKTDYLYQGKKFGGKLEAVKEICSKENFTLEDVAYIGDDINCYELLSSVGVAACPANAMSKIKSIAGINQMSLNGGEGVVREFAEKILLMD